MNPGGNVNVVATYCAPVVRNACNERNDASVSARVTLCLLIIPNMNLYGDVQSKNDSGTVDASVPNREREKERDCNS